MKLSGRDLSRKRGALLLSPTATTTTTPAVQNQSAAEVRRVETKKMSSPSFLLSAVMARNSF